MRRSSTKSRRVDDRQLRLFGLTPEVSEPAQMLQAFALEAAQEPLSKATPSAARRDATRQRPTPPAPRVIEAVPEVQSDGLDADEWWTTERVGAFLKLGRKAIWRRRRNPIFAFPKPANLGGGRNHYRASAIRMWAERMALASAHDA